jgi:hypothetical protein
MGKNLRSTGTRNSPNAMLLSKKLFTSAQLSHVIEARRCFVFSLSAARSENAGGIFAQDSGAVRE